MMSQPPSVLVLKVKFRMVPIPISHIRGGGGGGGDLRRVLAKAKIGHQ